MRNIHTIREEIVKLQSELKSAEAVESRKNGAVAVLHNLGWSWDGKSWVKPKFIAEAFDAKVHNPFRPGDWVEGRTSKVAYRVSDVKDGRILVQQFAMRVGARLLTHKAMTWVSADNYRSIPSSSL
ncbi:hypothetical protein HOT56_gp25 [Escherichia phage SRT7]|uniref:Uncharacterized protein n=1 Tax=Escherichia phage SRT7 TaxID=2268589 RepID=A0A2Z5H3J0_9CAUD|nr:hypothetical protein HOT56_gp25 [Escherichia phage SRT7]AXC34589.1 hypothetical protein [Escherichia phage SRT7]